MENIGKPPFLVGKSSAGHLHPSSIALLNYRIIYINIEMFLLIVAKIWTIFPVISIVDYFYPFISH